MVDTLRLFNAIANRYELVNWIISLGSHSVWNKTFVRDIIAKKNPARILDLCCGTGAISRCLIQELQKNKQCLPSIDCIDFSEHMLAVARKKIQIPTVRFICASAEDLPAADNSYDTICVAYGMRNIQGIQQAIHELFRVLQPGGSLHILELTQPKNVGIRSLHKLYLQTVVPVIGGLITGQFTPYWYLRNSILKFSPAALMKQLEDAGFQHLEVLTYSLGTISYIKAQKV